MLRFVTPLEKMVEDTLERYIDIGVLAR